MEQKNSAKIVACNDIAGPNPIGSLNVVNLALKSIIFAHPCVIIIKEVPIRSKSNATSVPHEEEEKNNFFIFKFLLNVVVCFQN